MNVAQFTQIIASVTDVIGGQPLNEDLQQLLNERFPADGEVYASIYSAIHGAVAEGWMCQHEHGGIKFGRVVKPTPELQGYSVDVVDMDNVVGPHHIHPNGEIDLIMPIDGNAKFDQHAAGWLVYPANSGHRPTVTDGRAYVLYLLPNGAIEFTKK